MPTTNTAHWQSTLADILADSSQSAAGQAVLRYVCETLRASAAVLVRSAVPRWRTIASVPAGTSPPIELAAEAVDAEKIQQADGWVALPLSIEKGQSSTARDVLLIQHVLDREAAESLTGAASLLLRSAVSLRQTSQRAQRFETLLEMTKQWRQNRDLQTLLTEIAEAATQLFGADRASIFLWDQGTKSLVGRPALGIEGDELRIPDDAGVVGEVLQSGEPRRVSKPDDGAIDRTTDEKTGYQTDSLLCVPMNDPEGNKLGVFELINKKTGEFTSEDLAGLVDVANYAAIVLTATQQFEGLLERHEQMVDQAASGVRLLGECPAIEALRSTIDRVADTDLSILILGENGCGKEVVAQSLHYKSGRREAPFIAVNCAAIAETLLESELFGHERGAFTDAQESRAGKFELASGGTLLLDEIGDMSLGGQAKLLRVLEEKTVVRVGGSLPIATDVRLLAATNQDLAKLVREKKFREDLYFRLNVVSIDLPPLRQRGDDILLLAEHFLGTFCQTMGRRTPKFTAEAKKRMLTHPWPGNVRELRNLMERVAYLSSGEKVEADDLAFTMSPERPPEQIVGSGLPLSEATKLFQKKYIRGSIDLAGGNVSQAAKQLGVHRSNLYRKMEQLDMSSQED